MALSIFWLVAGAIFIAIEIFGVPGIGFLFAGIGALAVGGLTDAGLIPPDNVQLQFVFFFVISCASAALLWKRLKRQKRTPYSNMVGSEAIVAKPGLVGSKEGQVKWSGTLMRARLIENDGLLAVADESTVVIKAVEGNLLIVAPAKNNRLV